MSRRTVGIGAYLLDWNEMHPGTGSNYFIDWVFRSQQDAWELRFRAHICSIEALRLWL
jgi:hypothetical protein